MTVSTRQRTLALTLTALMAIGVTSAHATGGAPLRTAATTDPVPTKVEYKLSVSKESVPHGIQVLVYVQTKPLNEGEVEKRPLHWRAKVDGHIWGQYQTDAFPGQGQGEQFAPVFRDGTGKHRIKIWVAGEGTVKEIRVRTGR